MKDFKDKVVVITGASSGIGEALAYEFARLGAKVVIAARSSEKLAEVADRIAGITETTPSAYGCHPSTGGELSTRVLAVTCDVSREADCRELMGEAVAAFGRIDVLICNAGISMRAILDEVDMSVLRRLMDVNFWGTAYSVKYALPWLQASHGSIVGVSSVAGLHGLPGRTGYSASKYAMTGFLETVRIENRHKGLHVMIACPGFTATNVRFTALTKDGTPQGKTPREEGKMMSAEEVARHIIKGIRRRKRLLFMEWEGRGTHIIKKFSPGFLDRMFYKIMSREPNSPLQ
jgi:NAD(P)-dependent dehydrogenase (short-subunit alcohol dehydrogenase family)